MLSVVLYKYLNCAVNKSTNTGHTTNFDYTLIASIMIMRFIISSWSNSLKIESCYLIQPVLPNAPPNRLISCLLLLNLKLFNSNWDFIWNKKHDMLENHKRMRQTNNQTILETPTQQQIKGQSLKSIKSKSVSGYASKKN